MELQDLSNDVEQKRFDNNWLWSYAKSSDLFLFCAQMFSSLSKTITALIPRRLLRGCPFVNSAHILPKTIHICVSDACNLAPQFSEFFSYMKSHDFVAFDIVLGWNRPLDNALGQIEVVFVKEDGMFRHDYSYSTLKQLKSTLGT